MNAEKIYKRRNEELEDIVHKQRLKIRGLERKLDRMQRQSALFVEHTIHIFQLCNIDWRDVVRLYEYSIAQEEVKKKNDKSVEECC